MHRLLLLALLALLTPCAAALVDPATPVDGGLLSTLPIEFTYYVSMDGVEECTLTIDGTRRTESAITDDDINAFTVLNLSDGEHHWNITCTANTSESSQTQRFILDTAAPAIETFGPIDGERTSDATLRFSAEDAISSPLLCEVILDGEHHTTLDVAGNASVAIDDLPPGNHTWRINCSDNASHTAASPIERFAYDLDPAELTFDLSTDKERYALGERVTIGIDAPQGTTVEVDVCPDAQGFVECRPTLLFDGPFPEERKVDYAVETGTYLVEAILTYGDEYYLATTSYAVENTLEVSIEGGDARVGEPFILKADSSGGVGDRAITWHLPDATTHEGDEIELTYDTPGERTIRAVVEDAQGNTAEQTITVDVERAFMVTITVTGDGSPIDGAQVEFSGRSRVSDAQGRVEIRVVEGAHDLYVLADGYEFLTRSVTIEEDRSIAVELEPMAGESIITAIAPANDARLSADEPLRFGAEGSFPMNCSIWVGNASDEWLLEHATITLEQAGEHSYPLGLGEGEWQWKVECVDAKGALASSAQRSFVRERLDSYTAATAEVTLQSVDIDASEVLTPFERALEQISSLSGKSKEGAQAMDLEGVLKDAIREIRRANRDIHDIGYRRDLSTGAKQQRREELRAEVDALLKRTPISLQVSRSGKFIEYPQGEELEGLIAQALELNRIDDERAIAPLERAQQGFTFQTSYYHAELGLSDGSFRTATIIEHAFTYENKSDDAQILLFIPKKVAASSSDIETTAEFEVLKEDPIIAIGKPDRFAFIVEGTIDEEQVRAVRPLLYEDPALSQTNQATGFAIIPDLEPTTLGILLMILLVSGYLFYIYNGVALVTEIVSKMRGGGAKQYLQVRINEAADNLDAGAYDEAQRIYEDVVAGYEQLAPSMRSGVHESIVELGHKLNFAHFLSLTEHLRVLIKDGERKAAIDAYEKLQGTFGLLREQDRTRVYDTVVELGRRLAGRR